MSTRHPVEGDGIRVNFFNLLLRTPGEVTPPLRVAIPDTIVFEHNTPRSWYYYDVENKEIRKRAGRDLQAGTILSEFSVPSIPVGATAGAAANMTTVATYSYLRHDDQAPGSSPSVTTLYLTREKLERLLIMTSVIKMEGILQKHLMPLEANECLIQATWGGKLSLVRRRMNCRPLVDKTRFLSEKHCTFDGPDHLSIEVATAKDTVADVTHTMERIVEHVNRTTRLKTVSMLLYFKLDQQKRPRLLWCSSLRFEGHRFLEPPAAVFVCPELETEDDSADDALLKEMSEAQQRLEKSHGGGGGDRGVSPNASPSRSLGGSDTFISMGGGSGGAISQGSLASLVTVAQPPDVLADIERICSQWYTVHDDVEDEYRRIQEQQAAAAQLVDDTLYNAHSQFQQQDPADATIRFPIELVHLLGGQRELDALIHAIGLSKLPNGDVVIPSPKTLQSNVPTTTVMLALSKDWLDKHFAMRMAGSLNRAATYVQWAALQAVGGRLH